MAINKLNQGTLTEASQLPFGDPQNGRDRRGSVADLAAVIAALYPLGAGSGDLLAANNLSDVANTATARSNLGAQPVAANLTQIAALVDPNADRLLFWDDSVSTWTYLTLGTNLSITGTTINATGGGGVAWGGVSGTLSAQTDLQAALDAKAALLTPFAETGTTFNITNAAHARDGTATNAAAITATFNFTGMVAGTTGSVQQLGAGVVTLAATDSSAAAVNYSYAPGVTASATTAGLGGIICWRYLGSNNVLIEFRSQAVAGGSSAVTYTTSPAQVVAPSNLAVNQLKNVAINGTPLTLGAKVRIEIGMLRTAQTGGMNLSFAVNGTALPGFFWDSNVNKVERVFHLYYMVTALSGNNVTLKGMPSGADLYGMWGAAGPTYVIDQSAGLSWTASVQKDVAIDPLTVTSFCAEVTQ